MSHAIEQSIRCFLKQPAAQRLVELQAEAFDCASYDPSARQLLDLESRLQCDDAAELLSELCQLDSIWELCPRYHFVKARIMETLRRPVEMRVAVKSMQSCLRGLMGTGEGTSHSPYCVTFLPDERDVMRVIGEEIRYRQVVFRSGRYCDVATSHTGHDVWFDVTPLVENSPQLVASASTGA